MSNADELEIGANPADVERNRMVGAGVVDDPYPKYDELRESGPVHEHSLSEAFGLTGPEGAVWAGSRQFACYDWETVDCVLRDAELCSSEWYERSLGVVIGRSMIQMGGTEHRLLADMIEVGSFIGMAAMTQGRIDPIDHS